MDLLIKKQEEVELTGDEVMAICDHKTNIISYHQLADVSHIDQILGTHNACIILYETRFNVGHYCALMLDGDTLNFFDPYGNAPDTQLKYAVYNLIYGEAYLTKLIKSSGYKLIYNTQRLQTWDRDTNTCGRWCSCRVRMRNLNNAEFAHIFKRNECYVGDFWVSALTFLYTSFR